MCVNTLVSAEEGKEEIKNMRKRFTPIIQSQPEPGIAAITNNQFVSIHHLLVYLNIIFQVFFYNNYFRWKLIQLHH